MSLKFEELREKLSPTQREAVDLQDGASLVLAGPGVGKTTVLTARTARILRESEGKNFRILALTFTTKAGDEMRERVERLVGYQAERATIGTFHSFAAQLLRQHGSHLGIKPDFGIYDQKEDRQELLREALSESNLDISGRSFGEVDWISIIDRLRGNLVSPEKAVHHFRNRDTGERVTRVYQVYEDALREQNLSDFNGMILDACRLAHRFPAVAARIRRSYPIWMIDEFQDTTPAQYWFIRLLAGDDFSNIFAVADDDQIIYQWAGASYRQIEKFRADYSPRLVQLVENRRCPPEIVSAANRLISFNEIRTPDKEKLVATLPSSEGAIRFLSFETQADEAAAICQKAKELEPDEFKDFAVLGRTRNVLSPVLEGLKEAGVPASIATRRDRYVSAQFNWLQSCLDLAIRPNSRLTLSILSGAANRIAGTDLDPNIVSSEADSSGIGYLEAWALATDDFDSDITQRLSSIALELVQTRSNWRNIVDDALHWLPTTEAKLKGETSDSEEDRAAWVAASNAIKAEFGGKPELDELLRGIAMRPKEPPIAEKSVRLFTIHAAKGLEFKRVWLMGASEGILPSWQSLKVGAQVSELEEERRNFFVGITRTERELVVSHADEYFGRKRKASRFILEMAEEHSKN